MTKAEEKQLFEAIVKLRSMDRFFGKETMIETLCNVLAKSQLERETLNMVRRIRKQVKLELWSNHNK